MSGAHARARRWKVLRRFIAIPLVFTFASGVSWAYWSAGSVSGGNGASAASSVNQGPTPSVSAAGNSVAVTWATSTLSNNTTPISTYTLQRYDSAGTAAQSMSSCTGTISATACTETGVPDGRWTYKVTPLFQLWAGLASAASTAVVVDTVPPSGGSVTVSNLTGTGPSYSRSTGLSLVLNRGTDTNGFATGAQLSRATATLSSAGTDNGTCSALSDYTLIATDPSTPIANVAPDKSCVSYRYVVVDPSGNTATYTSATAKIDSTAPATPALSFGGTANAYWSGSSLFYRSNASGSFTATAAATDSESGIASYAFTSPGTNWTSSAVTSGVNIYSWTSGATGTTAAVTATNHAGGVSGSTAFTLVPDNTAPTGVSVTATGTGTGTGRSVKLEFSSGTDGDSSGLGTRQLQRAWVAVSGGICPTTGYSAFETIYTDPAISPVTDTIAAGTCKKYQYVVADKVGNAATATSSAVLGISYTEVIAAHPKLFSYWRLGDSISSTSSTMAATKIGTAGTYYGTPTSGQGGALNETNTAVKLNGTNQRGTAPIAAVGTAFSAELWFRSTSTTGATTTCNWNAVPSMVQNSTNGQFLQFGISLCGGKISAGTDYYKDSSSIVSSEKFNDGNWHHVVLTHSGPGMMVLYVDGTPVGEKSIAAVQDLYASTIHIAGTTTSSNNFAGTLDEISIYNAVLTADEVKSHFNAR